MEGKDDAPNKVRTRRARADIREALLQSAVAEFGAKGFDGASTRAIALRIEAHQPQINYHFESKEALWTASVDYLFGLLSGALDGALPNDLARATVPDLADAFAEGIRRFVQFAAEHPELNQIMVHEGTAASARLAWITETHIKPVFNAISFAWRILRDAGSAAPIDSDVLYYLLVGAATQPYVTAAEVRLVAGRDPRQPEWINAHADALVAILLPGLSKRVIRKQGKRRET
ncbi:MAG TPA: TetR/AcrR family transcriptional regulator [Acidimicrobiales bacterium]|jgi:AcrR family transcriptional regulator|nr:TetR/AcrR family transcriptional regulator [Acidimicrobiales bacterium]